MAKRGNGEGHIRKRKDGSWEGQYSAGYDPKTGKFIRRSVYAKTQSAVRKKMRAKIEEANKGVYSDLSNKTVFEWMDIFLWEIKRPFIKEKTFAGYEEDINRYIKTSEIAKIKIEDVRKIHIQKFIDTLISADRPPFLVHRIYRTFRCAINEAERQDVISISYAKGIRLPKKTAKLIRLFNQEEEQLFLNKIKGHRLEAAFIVALTTGVREGELAALKWSDYRDNRIYITKDATRVPIYDKQTHEKIGSHIIIQDTPKTAAGTRDIPLMEIAEEALERHREKQDYERAKYGEAYDDSDWIFCHQLGGLYDPKHFYCQLRKIIKSIGIEHIKFHGLRHTFATWGLESGIEVKAMQELLGHETPEMTMHYQHLRKEQARVEIDKLEKRFKKPSEKITRRNVLRRKSKRPSERK